MTNSKLPVRDVMITPVITIGPDATVKEAAALMQKHDIGGLVVVDKLVPVGMITERDFVRLLARNSRAQDLIVKNVMSKKLITISPNESLVDAAHLIINTKKRKIPVIENGQLIGIITADDIVRVAPAEIEFLRELVKIKGESENEFREEAPTEGECDNCGNYSNKLAETEDDVFLCEECRKKPEEQG